jgi:hypothetical protein
MRVAYWITVGGVVMVLALSGCNRSGPVEKAPVPMYTARAYVEVLPVAQGSVLAETLGPMAMPERVALEVKLARDYDLAGEILAAPDLQVTDTEWYKGIGARDPNEALAAVMNIRPAGDPGQISVSVTLDDPADAALLATAAARAVVARSTVSVGELYDHRIHALLVRQDELSQEIASKIAASRECRSLLDPGEVAAYERALAELEAQEAALKASITEAEDIIRMLNEHSGDQLVALPVVREALDADGDYALLEDMVEMLRENVRQARLEHDRSDAAVQDAARELADASAELMARRSAAVEGLRAQAGQTLAAAPVELETISDQCDVYRDMLARAGDAETTLATLEVALDRLISEDDDIRREIETLVALAERARRLRVAREAALPTKPN